MSHTNYSMNTQAQDLPYQATNPLTPQELDHLAEVREVCQTVNSAGWRRILAQMKTFVDEAQEAMIAAPYAADSVKAAMLMRWQQRISMLRGVEKYIESCEFSRQQLLEEIKPQQRSVPTEEYAERDSEVA